MNATTIRNLAPILDELTPLDVLLHFMPYGERMAIKSAMRGEERKYFAEKLKDMVEAIKSAPRTGDTNGQGDDALVVLHYFGGNCDAWITELDAGAPDDTLECFQQQAFGFVCLGDPQCAELGYVSIPDLVQNNMELDLHWRRQTVGEIKAKLGR